MKKTSIIAMLLAAVCATSCFVGGTFAKYTSTVAGSDTVKVAKWDVALNGASSGTTNEFDLFSTANYDEADEDVADGLVAPGTQGSFAFEVTNSSEVSVNYSVTFEVAMENEPDGATLPIKFYSDEDMTQEIVAAEGVYTAVAATEIEVGGAATSATVYWKWAFNNDVDETAWGIAAQDAENAPAFTVTATAQFDQVD